MFKFNQILVYEKLILLFNINDLFAFCDKL